MGFPIGAWGLGVLNQTGGGFTAAATVGAAAIGANAATGGLTKDGSGILTLAGNNAYTGATAVSDGTLVLNGDNSLAVGPVSVTGTATLAGSGTLGAIVSLTTGTRLDPGPTVPGTGVLTASSSVSFTSGAVFRAQVNGSQTGDTVNFGTLTFASAGNVALREDSGTVLTGSNSAGSLILEPAGTVTVDAGSLTAGGEIRVPLISLGGRIDPGSPAASPNGTLTARAGATLQPGTRLRVGLTGDTAGTYDQLAVHGTVDLGGTTLEIVRGFAFRSEAVKKLVLDHSL